MKKFCICLLILSFLNICLCGCTKKPKKNMIQAKRRFAEYVDQGQIKDSNRIDLSEGPKLQYDRPVGPQNLNFDIKIVDPY